MLSSEKTISFGYDTANRLDGISYPNGVNSTFGHDAEGHITSIQHGSFIDRTIQRNVLGFKETELIDAGLKPTAPETGRRIKTHNDADQLTGEWVQQGTNEFNVSHTYSDNGGLFQTSEDGSPETQYGYDYADRLESVSLSADIEYLYGASGARVGRVSGTTTNYFVVDYTDGLKRPLAETDSSGTVTRFYVWSGSQLLCHIEADGTTRYYHSDELGSTLALTDESGNVTDEFAYMPYGYARHQGYAGSSDTPFQWLGGYGVYYDSDTDLHLTLYRAYSSKQKRFISADPLGIDGGVNVYAMANLNPFFFVDPYGLSGLESSSGGIRGLFNLLVDTEVQKMRMQAEIGNVQIDRMKDWHYSRNAANDAYWRNAGLYGRDDIRLSEFPDAKFIQVSDEEDSFHEQGLGNENNIKFTTMTQNPQWWNRYGKNEIIVRPNGDDTHSYVSDPINMGTLNRGQNPVTHTVLDVVPYLPFGNSPDDPTTFSQRWNMMFKK